MLVIRPFRPASISLYLERSLPIQATIAPDSRLLNKSEGAPGWPGRCCHLWATLTLAESRVMADSVGSPAAWFRFFPVEAPLDRYVGYLYTSVVPKAFVDRIIATRLPELEAQVVFVLEEGKSFPGARAFADGFSASLFVQPAHLQVVPISGTIRAAVGASLRPAGLRLLLKRGAGDLSADPLIALEDLCGESARVLCDRLIAAPGPNERLVLLRAYLEERARRGVRVHESAAYAVQLMKTAHGAVSVEAVARTCGVTSRTLRDVLLSETGMSPKHLARVLRVRHALDAVRQGGPVDASEIHRAFADQAHRCREFRALLDVSPAALARELRGSPNQVPRVATDRELMGTGLLIRAARYAD